jgi:C1A family cysteine protease
MQTTPHVAESTLGRKYTCRPNRPALLTRKLIVNGFKEDVLPTEADLTPTFSPNYDQLDVGSCVDNAVVGIAEHLTIVTKYKNQFRGSRLFNYWNARGFEGTQSSDAGSSIADGVKALRTFGICPEIEGDGTNPDWLFPYGDAASKLFLQTPPAQCYKDAVLHESLDDAQVSLDRNTILNLLAHGTPIVFGFTVNQSFEDPEVMKTGVMKTPGMLFDPVLGGHGVVAVGYALNKPQGSQGIKDWALIRNSWGTSAYPDMGKLAGNFWMPLDQVLCNGNIASDGHVITTIGFRHFVNVVDRHS